MAKDNLISIDSLIKQMKTDEELRTYCNSQYQIIVKLQKKTAELEEKNRHLEELLKNSGNLPVSSREILLNPDNDEQIAREQLQLLKIQSSQRELTLEETKRFEVYAKFLNNKFNNSKTIVVESKKLQTDELLALASMNDDARDKN